MASDNQFLFTRDSNFQPPAPASPTAFETARSPREFGLTMAKLIDNQWGPCPITPAPFPMHGGTLVISFSASVHTDQPVPGGSLAQVGYEIFVDGVSVGTARAFVWAQDVWTNCSTDLIVSNLSPDNHTVTIQPWGPYTSNDQFNIFNLTVMEF